jgi:alkylation response protein AidB-like acyl-CoA dehydrogenase
MQLDFTADQEELRALVRAVLDKECSPALVRTHVERVVAGEPSAAGRELYATFAGLDWPALTIAEANGGIGLGFVELAVVAEELGRVIAPGPLLATMAGFVPLLREAGADARLAAVAAGTTSGTAAHGARFVLHADEVDEIAIVGDRELIVAPAAAVPRTPVRSIDATRSIAHIDIDAIDAAAGERFPITAEGVQRALEELTVAIAFEMVGTCQTIFDTSLRYAKERQQFGVPIGSFQAVKHKLANMFVAIQRARGVCIFATATILEDDPRRTTATATAKAAAGDCQRLVAADGIQLLGGIGYTWEHDQHLYVKRVKASDALYGNAAYHRQRIADALGL